MNTAYLKKLGRSSVLAVAFAVSAGAGQQALAQGNSAYTSVQQRMAGVEDIAKQIQMTKHTQEVLGLPQNAAEIAELKASLKKGADAVGPRIVLTPGLTPEQTQELVDEFAGKIGPLPDYLAKINHKAKLVNVCTQELLPDDNVYTVSLASTIANCVDAKKLVAAPVKEQNDAPVAPVKIIPPAPVKTTLPAPQETPAPVKTAASQPQPVTAVTKPASEAKASGFDFTSPVNLGIEFGAVALLLGGGIVVMRRKPQSSAPETVPVAKTLVDDTPPKKTKKFDL